MGQRVFGIALGYEDLNDHDELCHDPVMAVLAGKLEARRDDCAPVAGKSTLNRLELSRLEATRYHKISHNPIAIKRLMVDLFLDAHVRAPREIVLDLDATDDPVHGEQEGRWRASLRRSAAAGAYTATAAEQLNALCPHRYCCCNCRCPEDRGKFRSLESFVNPAQRPCGASCLSLKTDYTSAVRRVVADVHLEQHYGSPIELTP